MAAGGYDLRSSKANDEKADKNEEKEENFMQTIQKGLAEVLTSECYKSYLQMLIKTSVESEFTKLSNELIEVKELNLQLQSEIVELKVELSKLTTTNNENINTYANKVKNNTTKNKNNNKQKVDSNDNKNIKNGNQDSAKVNPNEKPPITPTTNKDEIRVDNTPTPASKVLINKKIIEVNNDDNLEDSEDDDFTPVSYRKKRKNLVIKGNGPISDDLQCADARIWIFLGRCIKNTSTDNIKAYLKRIYPENDFIVDSLNSKGYYESFRIGADKKLIESIYDSKIWPTGAIIKRYIFRKPVANFSEK